MLTIHPLADVHSKRIGKNTRIWQFVVVLEGAIIGEDSNICANSFVENEVIIGNNVTVKSGVYLWDGTCLEDDTFVGPNATFTNDSFPRSKKYPEEFSGILVKRGASIGANATLLPGIIIGEFAMIGAGSVVTKSVEPYAVMMGNPAKLIRYLPHD